MAPIRLRARLWAGLAAAHLAVAASPLAAGDAPAVLPPAAPPAGLTVVPPPASAPLTLTIEEARLKALAANSSLELGRLNIQEKEIAISAAKRDYFPKVLGTGAYFHYSETLGQVISTRTRELGGATIGPGGVIQVPNVTIPGKSIASNILNQDGIFGVLMVAQPITKLIGVSVLVDLARADAAIAAAQLDKGTHELLTGVTQAYYGLAAAKKIEAALSMQAGAVEELLKLSNNVELRLGLLELRKGIAETRKQIDELTATLVQLLGLPPCTCLETVEPVVGPVPVACADEAAQLALVNNAQIREAEQSIAKAHAGLRAAKMDCLPDVNVLGGVVGQNATDVIQQDFSFVGVTASYTFVDWGKRREVKRQREAQIALAGQNVRVVTESVQLEARKAFHAYKLAESEAQIAAEVVRVRSDAEKDAKEPAAIAAAKAATAKAQIEQMQADVNYRLAHAKLLGAIGQP